MEDVNYEETTSINKLGYPDRLLSNGTVYLLIPDFFLITLLHNPSINLLTIY